MEKSKKFKEIFRSGKIIYQRKKMLKEDNRVKILWFEIEGDDYVKERPNIDEISDKRIEEEKKNINDTQVLYVWNGDDFKKQ